MEQKPFYQYLSRPFKFLWFEADDFIILFFCIYLGIFLSIWFVLAGIIGTWSYMRIKKMYPRGFLGHLLFHCGIVTMDGYPLSFSIEFYE